MGGGGGGGGQHDGFPLFMKPCLNMHLHSHLIKWLAFKRNIVFDKKISCHLEKAIHQKVAISPLLLYTVVSVKARVINGRVTSM